MNLSEMTGFSEQSQRQFQHETAVLHDAMEDQFSYALRVFEDKAATHDTLVGFRHKLAFGLVSVVSLIFEDANRLVAFVRTDADEALKDKMLDMLNHIAVALVLLDERTDQARLNEAIAAEQLPLRGSGIPFGAEPMSGPAEERRAPEGEIILSLPIDPEDEEELPLEPTQSGRSFSGID